MKTFIGKTLLPKLASNQLALPIGSQSVQPALDWPTFLEAVDLGTLLLTFPPFDASNGLYNFLISSSAAEATPDLLMRIFDQIFVECLTLVKALPQVDQTFLLEQIHNSKRDGSPLQEELDHYTLKLIEQPYDTMHDLTLYLGWDRVTTYLAVIFEAIPVEPRFHQVLEVLKECLLESFQHITGKGRTRPSFYRLVEALYALEMRPDRLDNHSEEEWDVLARGSRALQPRGELTDVAYVDQAMRDTRVHLFGENSNLVRVVTTESAEVVIAGLDLAHNVVGRLKQDRVDWHYAIGACEVVCLLETDAGLQVDRVISRSQG